MSGGGAPVGGGEPVGGGAPVGGAEPGEDPGVVLVARELEAVWDGEPAWPGGHETVLLGREEPLPAADRAVALIPLLSRRIGAPELDALPSLRVVANYAVGYDNIDLRAAAARGVAVTNTPDVLTEATADLTWALILAATRRLREGLELAVSGRWRGWEPGQLLGSGLQGRTLAMLGAGRIGRAVARRAPAFGLEVIYWSRSRAEALEAETGARRRSRLEEALEEGDVVSVHLPLTGETRNLLGAEELRRMKPTAALVNTARGEIVDEPALIRALREGRPGAAGLDVFAEEPEIPAALRELPNAFLLPHLGSATREARRAMWRVAAENVRRVLAGDPPVTPVAVPQADA